MSDLVRSIDSASGTVKGESTYLVPESEISMVVAAHNLDPANDTLRCVLDVKIDGFWTVYKLTSNEPNTQAAAFDISVASLTQIDDNDPYTALLTIPDTAITEARVRISEFDDAADNDLTVTALLLASEPRTKVKQ